MPHDSKLRRIARLSGPELMLFGEALLTLVAASAAIRLLPFNRVARLASSSGRPAASGERDHEAEMLAVRRVVQAWARRVPWKTVCFQIGLAAHWMLRRRGLDSRLHYGVGRRDQDELAAHVWVTLQDKVVVGEFEAAQFAHLATFPAASPDQRANLS